MQVLLFPSPFSACLSCAWWCGWGGKFGGSRGCGVGGHFQGKQHGILSFAWRGKRVFHFLILFLWFFVVVVFFCFFFLLLLFTYSCKIPSAWPPAAPPSNKQLASCHIRWDMWCCRWRTLPRRSCSLDRSHRTASSDPGSSEHPTDTFSPRCTGCPHTTWPLEAEGKERAQGKSLIRWIIMNPFQAGSDGCWVFGRTKLGIKN